MSLIRISNNVVHKTWAGKKQTAKPASGRVKVLLHPFFSPLSRPTTRSPKVLDRMRTNLITNELNISCMIVIEPSEDEDLTLIDHTSLSTLSTKKNEHIWHLLYYYFIVT